MLVISGNASHNTNGRRFFVNGTAGGTSAWFNDSDIRLKTNIVTLTSALSKVMMLRGVSFDWIDTQNFDSERHIGFIAQEVKDVLPEVVAGSDNSRYSMQYAPITALLVEAIKEQQAEIDGLNAELQKVRDENTYLSKVKEELESLKERISAIESLSSNK
jgi:hypothetical protein